jgi:hypothetical protein
MELQKLTRVFGIYAGRDKFLRAAYAGLVILATKEKDPEKAKRILAFAKQFSLARLIFRQCNHPQMFSSIKDLYLQFTTSNKIDIFDYFLTSSITGIYTVYGFAELIAWLSDAKIIVADSGKWFKWCLYLWLGALAAGIIRTIRQIFKKPFEKSKNDQITLLGFICDFISGANSLPPGMLWSGKLTPRQSATFSFIASAIGFWKLY